MARARHSLIEHHRSILDRETGAVRKEPGGRLNVAMLYPNTYAVGMANLGLAVVYRLINQRRDALCERAFLPDRKSLPLYEKSNSPLLSLESSRPLDKFDLVLATVSFENDAPNLAAMLMRAGLSLDSADRWGPLVIAGGVVPMLNPEPLAEMVDGFLLGEAEVALTPFLDAYMDVMDRPRPEALLHLAREVPGFYAPRFYQVEYRPDGVIDSFAPSLDVPGKIAVPKYHGPAAGLAVSQFKAPGPEFGDMTLLEVGRGCGHGCRFCAAGHIFRPPRLGHGRDFSGTAQKAAQDGGGVGLVSAAVTDLLGLDTVAQGVLGQGGRLSMSSLRADCLTPELVQTLVGSRQQTVALAPEAGSERLRRSINKHLSEEDLATAVEMLINGGIPNLRLYFMVGLPGETEDDVDRLITLARQVRQQMVSLSRARGRLGRLTVSLNAFVPKPWTPFQWQPMAPLKLIKERMRRIKGELAKVANLKVVSDVPQYALLQAVISRGDRRVAALIKALAQGVPLKKAYSHANLDPGFYANRPRRKDEILPWAFVDHGLGLQYLWEEAKRAETARQSPACEPETCRRCGVCKGPEAL